MLRTLWEDGTIPKQSDNLADDGFASFRELVLFVKRRHGLFKQLFGPDEHVLVEAGNEVGGFSGGNLDFEGRRLVCVKSVLMAGESAAPVVFAVMEPGTDLPVYQSVKHHSIAASKKTNTLQFIRSVPNSRIWKQGLGFTIHDQERKLLAQVLVGDTEQKPPEPGVALIHLRADLDPGVAQELVAILLTLKFLK